MAVHVGTTATGQVGIIVGQTGTTMIQKTGDQVTERRDGSAGLNRPNAYRPSTVRTLKNCIQKLLNPNEERETCQIPLDQIHQEMTECYADTHTEGEKPDWIRSPDRESTDVLDAPFTKDEVIFQVRRLPTRSAPGPDRLTYQNWKAGSRC